jgi:hypothetical protein
MFKEKSEDTNYGIIEDRLRVNEGNELVDVQVCNNVGIWMTVVRFITDK